jgi:exopolysaccharide biosynthesis protein
MNGYPLIIKGQIYFRGIPEDGTQLNARVAIATNAPGTTLWIVVVDGKQLFYSEGMTFLELTELLMKLGVYDAINLDGGGSATLVMETSWGAKLLNAPIHTHVPLRERPVGNHLGFYAEP